MRIRPLIALSLLAALVPHAMATAPTVQTVVPASGSIVTTSSGFTSITVTFSQPVVNVLAESLLVDNNPANTLLEVGTSGSAYTFGFTQPAVGQVTVSWDPDNAIANSAGTQFGFGTPFSYTLQANSPPTMTVQNPPPGITVDRLTQCEVTFSTAVQNVTASSLLINGQAATNVSGSGPGPYVFSFPQPANGTITFQWAAGQDITDFASPPNAFAGGSWTATMNTASGVSSIRINEFLADNANNPSGTSDYVDEDGSYSPWIELYNSGTSSVNLAGWSITDDSTQPELWIFPSGSQSVIAAGGYLVIWADSKNVTNPAAGNKMHTNFTLSQNGSYLGLFSADLPRTTAEYQFSPSYPIQEADVSYGYDSSTGTNNYFTTPTPGAANGTSTITGVAPDVSFSVPDGYFDGPFNLVLSTATSGIPIYYTTDSSIPTATNGTLYTGPIPISATTVVRAAAIGTTLLSSDVGTESFYFVASTLSQPANPPGFPTQFTGDPVNDTWLDYDEYSPTTVLNGSQCYFQVDPGIAAQDASYITAGLLSIPTLEVTTTEPDMFSQANGLYTHPVEDGSQWERPCSLEMIFPDGSQPNLQINCGIQIQGGSSRDPVKNFKHSFRAVFKDFYGAGELEQSIYPDSPASEFNTIVFDGGSNDTYDYVGGEEETYQRAYAQQTHDAYTSDLQIAMGWPSFHSKFCNLYIDGLYWGMYYYHDREDADFAATYWGGTKEEYDVVRLTTTSLEVETTNNGFETESSVPSDPHLIQWNKLINFLNANNNTLTATGSSAAGNALYTQCLQYVDADALADYMLANLYTGNTDWPQHNWYAMSHETQYGGNGKFYFGVWDAEHVLESNNATEIDDYDNGSGQGGPGQIWGALRTNAEFRLLFADHVQKQFFNGGVLSGTNPEALYLKRTNEINNAIAGESAKWGAYTQYYANTPIEGSFAGYGGSNSEFVFGTYTRENQWLPVLNDLLGLGNPAISGDPSNNWFALRNAFVLGQFQSTSRNLFPPANAQAPIFSQFGGRVPLAYSLSMSLPAGTTGTMYYTTDGSDPRVFGSGVPATSANGGTALPYTAPITLNSSQTVKARVLNTSSVWSALTNASFSVGSPVVPVRITEIMYNPAGKNTGDLGFIEIENLGANSINIGGYYFLGVSYIFPPNTVIAPGQFMVIGSDSDISAWQAEYPTVSAIGYFDGGLSNSGQQVALLNTGGEIVDSVNYLSNDGWPTAADGNGPSLEIINPMGNPDDPTNWQASAVNGGTPGKPNSTPVNGTGTFQLSEIMANNVSAVVNGGIYSPWIEVQNNTSVTASIAGWTLSDPVASQKYNFPSGTTIPANGYLVVWCDSADGAPGLHTGFPLNPTGDTVQLLDSNKVRWDAVQFGNQPANYSIGKISGTWQLTNPTPNAANTAAALAPSSSVVINEWMANALPPNPPWIELYNTSSTLPAALKGDILQTNTDLFQITALTFIAPNGYLQLFTDDLPGVNHVDFILPASGTTLSLLDPNGNTLNTVTFGAQALNVSQGRNPNGSSTIVSFPDGGSPGAANYSITYMGPALNEVLAINVTGAQAPWGTRAGWVEFLNPSGTNSFDMSGMQVNIAQSGSGAWTFPSGSVVPANGYLMLWCDPAHAASTAYGANMNTALTLSGSSGGVYLLNASGQLVNLVQYGFQIQDQSIGVLGGQWQLLSSPTPGAANAAAATLGNVMNLRINEWLASESTGNDWFELYNMDTNPVNMAGLYLSDDPSTTGITNSQAGPLSFIAGKGFAVFQADKNLDAGSNHVNFKLSASGEYIILSDDNSSLTQIDAVSFGQQTKDVTMGRIPDGSSNIVFMPGSPTPGAKNILLPAPSISTQPSSQTVASGSTAVLTVTGSGSAPLTYQWMFNNAPISGATSPILTVSNATIANDGPYSCVLANTAGSLASSTASLVVQSNFSQWESYYFGNSSNGGPTATPLGDGVPNLLKFFADINPFQAMTAANWAALPKIGLIPTSGTSAYVTLTFRESSRASFTGVVSQTSSSPAAGSFSTVAPNVTQSLGNDPITGDPIYLWEFAVPPGQTEKFFRLLITE
jgi:hypothetical protein